MTDCRSGIGLGAGTKRGNADKILTLWSSNIVCDCNKKVHTKEGTLNDYIGIRIREELNIGLME